MAGMTEARTDSGTIVYFDPEVLAVAYGAHAVRVTIEGDLQVLVITTEEVEWRNLEDADLVQPAGKPAKARKQ